MLGHPWEPQCSAMLPVVVRVARVSINGAAGPGRAWRPVVGGEQQLAGRMSGQACDRHRHARGSPVGAPRVAVALGRSSRRGWTGLEVARPVVRALTI